MLLIRRLLCLLGFHSPFVLQDYSVETYNACKKLGCHYCSRKWAWTANTGISLPWHRSIFRAFDQCNTQEDMDAGGAEVANLFDHPPKKGKGPFIGDTLKVGDEVIAAEMRFVVTHVHARGVYLRILGAPLGYHRSQAANCIEDDEPDKPKYDSLGGLIKD